MLPHLYFSYLSVTLLWSCKDTAGPNVSVCADMIIDRWTSGSVLTSSNVEGWGNQPFTLYLMEEQTGYSYDDIGLQKYYDVCESQGLLVIGCGLLGEDDNYDCAMDRPRNDHDCVPMPADWNCVMTINMSQQTGWDNVVALYTDGGYTLYTGDGDGPSADESLRAVCGKFGHGANFSKGLSSLRTCRTLTTSLKTNLDIAPEVLGGCFWMVW